ncbi:hypothetical protein EMIT0P201_30527 [Pseudomonas chlororaphis]
MRALRSRSQPAAAATGPVISTNEAHSPAPKTPDGPALVRHPSPPIRKSDVFMPCAD